MKQISKGDRVTHIGGVSVDGDMSRINEVLKTVQPSHEATIEVQFMQRRNPYRRLAAG